MNRIYGAGPAFCMAAGGLAVCILFGVGLFDSAAVFTLSLLYLLYCRAAVAKGVSVSSARLAFGAYSVISASVSLILGVRLLTAARVTDTELSPLLVLLTLALAVCFALSDSRAVSSVAFTTAAISFLIMTVCMVSCIVSDNLTLPAVAPRLDIKAVFALCVLSVFDIVLALPFSGTSAAMLACGTVSAHGYAVLTTVLSMAVLSKEIIAELNSAWLTAWKSGYLLSVVNSFEILGVCAFFALCAVKCSIAVKISTEAFGKRCLPLTAVACLLTAVLLSKFAKVFFAAAAVMSALALYIPLAVIFRHKKTAASIGSKPPRNYSFISDSSKP